MPELLPQQDLLRAEAAVRFAQGVRANHRKRTKRTSDQRKADLLMARERLSEAMKPLRSAIGKFPYGPQTETAEANRLRIYAASLSIQRERRKVWKMQNPNRKDTR